MVRGGSTLESGWIFLDVLLDDFCGSRTPQAQEEEAFQDKRCHCLSASDDHLLLHHNIPSCLQNKDNYRLSHRLFVSLFFNDVMIVVRAFAFVRKCGVTQCHKINANHNS